MLRLSILPLLLMMHGCIINNSTGGEVYGNPAFVKAMLQYRDYTSVGKGCPEGYEVATTMNAQNGHVVVNTSEKCLSLEEIHRRINAGADTGANSQ